MDTHPNDELEVPDLRTWRIGRRRQYAAPGLSTGASSMTVEDSGAGWTERVALLRADHLKLWVMALIAVSCFLVPVLFATAMYLTWDTFLVERYDAIVIVALPTLAVILGMSLWLNRASELSSWVRAAVLVPIMHIAFMALAWVLWHYLVSRDNDVLERLPLISDTVAPQLAIMLGAVVVLGALLPTGRRNRGQVPAWLRATVTFALANVLLLGLWLPIAANGWEHLFQTHFMREGWIYVAAPRTLPFVQVALIPPTIAALLFAVVSTIWPSVLRKVAGHARWLFALGLGIAIVCRLTASFPGFVAYANLVHVLLADAAFSLLCVLALGVAHARVLFAAKNDASRPAPWVQRGVIESSDDSDDSSHTVGTLRYLGWLHGLRGQVRRFWLRTDQGLLEVPSGARLVAPLPISSMRAGMCADEGWPATTKPDTPMLRAGDEVSVSGYVEPPGEGVFRRHALPVPGAHGLLVTRARRPDESVWRDVQLLMWRPCVLFLLVVSAAAVPGVVALALL